MYNNSMSIQSTVSRESSNASHVLAQTNPCSGSQGKHRSNAEHKRFKTPCVPQHDQDDAALIMHDLVNSAGPFEMPKQQAKSNTLFRF